MFPKVFKSIHNSDAPEWYAREIPYVDGIYVRIDKRCAYRLMRNKDLVITVSSSKGYFFTDFYNKNWEEFCKFLSAFHEHYCDKYKGNNINYWAYLGNLSDVEAYEIADSYPKTGKASYSTIIKWYNKYSKKGE